MKHEINLWKRAAARVNIASREESIMKALFLQKATEKENALVRLIYNMRLGINLIEDVDTKIGSIFKMCDVTTTS